MISVSGREFDKICRSREVGLNEILRESLLASLEASWFDDPISNGGTPTQLLSAVSAAGDLVMGLPHEPLAKNRISLPLAARRDPVATVLERIVNSSINPISSASNSFDSYHHSLDSCSEAEHRFLETFLSLQRSRQTGQVALGCQIVIKDERPLMLTKNNPIKSSINFRDIVIDGIPYPAGSILRTKVDEGSPFYGIPKEGVQILPFEEITGVGFLRLSAFFLRPWRRALTFGKLARSSETGTKTKGYMVETLESLGRIASSALEQAETQEPVGELVYS